jgi:ATP-dependent Lhr-like helicase
MGRRWLDDASAADLGRLDAAAIERVRAEAWPEATNADELHDALLGLGFVMRDEVDRQASWRGLLDSLWRAARRVVDRATRVKAAKAGAEEPAIWVAQSARRSFTPCIRTSFSLRLKRPRSCERTWARDDAGGDQFAAGWKVWARPRPARLPARWDCRAPTSRSRSRSWSPKALS